MSDGVWWLSFSPPNKSKSGVVILPHEEGELMLDAIKRAHELNCSPAESNVMGNWAPTDTWIDSGEAWVLRSEYHGRLISHEELATMGYKSMSTQEVIDSGVEIKDGQDGRIEAGNDDD